MEGVHKPTFCVANKLFQKSILYSLVLPIPVVILDSIDSYTCTSWPQIWSHFEIKKILYKKNETSNKISFTTFDKLYKFKQFIKS